MTPELLNLLTPEERATYDDAAGFGFGASDALRRIQSMRTALPAALTTIATLRADYRTLQERFGRAWEALCTIGDAVDKAGHYTLIPERAMHVGDAVNALIAEADQLRRDRHDAESAASAEAAEADRLRAENATLRHHLAEQQRAFVVGLEVVQQAKNEEIVELRATLDNERGEGVPPSPGWVYGQPWGMCDDAAWFNATHKVWFGPAAGIPWSGRNCWYWAANGKEGAAVSTARAGMQAADAAVKETP